LGLVENAQSAELLEDAVMADRSRDHHFTAPLMMSRVCTFEEDCQALNKSLLF
jgi:hypothetical protein